MRDDMKATLVGVIGGAAGGLVGIGGGIIMVPLMIHFFNFTQHTAHATSLAAIVPISVISANIYNAYGNMDFGLAALFAVGGMVGAYIGSTLMPYIKPTLLQRMLAIVVIAAAIRMGVGL